MSLLVGCIDEPPGRGFIGGRDELPHPGPAAGVPALRHRRRTRRRAGRCCAACRRSARPRYGSSRRRQLPAHRHGRPRRGVPGLPAPGPGLLALEVGRVPVRPVRVGCPICFSCWPCASAARASARARSLADSNVSLMTLLPPARQLCLRGDRELVADPDQAAGWLPSTPAHAFRLTARGFSTGAWLRTAVRVTRMTAPPMRVELPIRPRCRAPEARRGWA